MGKLSGFKHRISWLVTNLHPFFKQNIQGKALAHLNLLGGPEKIPTRQGTGHQSACRGNDDRRQNWFFNEWKMICRQTGQRLQPLTPGGGAPGRHFVKKWIGFRKDIPGCPRQPKSQFIMQLQGMVSAVSYQNNRLFQVRIQRCQYRQARRARQSQTGELIPCP